MKRDTEEAIEAARTATQELAHADREWRCWEGFSKKAEQRYKLAQSHVAKVMGELQTALVKDAQAQHTGMAETPMSATEVLAGTPCGTVALHGALGHRTYAQLQADAYQLAHGPYAQPQWMAVTVAELRTLNAHQHTPFSFEHGSVWEGVRLHCPASSVSDAELDAMIGRAFKEMAGFAPCVRK